ncbi:MAG: TIGR04141 family sporadically distributed protein [Spirochaetales bacterium]|nr:TIGR04141 family sporadically distributed protein [Spirochaetales bacterium]
MNNFTIYLIKDSYEFIERYDLIDGKVVENMNSVFNDGVTASRSVSVEQYISKKKYEIRRVKRSSAKELIYFRETNNPNPWWKIFWDIPENLENKSTDIIIFKNLNGKKVVIVHGHGRFLINPLSIVYDFGLRTALNLLDENKIKSADVFTPSEIALRTRKQSGKSTNFDEYDINIYTSLLKSITGKVNEKYSMYFKNIDGADSIKFTFNSHKDDLFEVIEELIRIYTLQDYKNKGYEWIDNFRIIKDKGMISILDKNLVEQINCFNNDVVLMYPEIIERNVPVFYRYSGFNYHHRDESKYPELDIEEQYYYRLKKYGLTVTLEDLKAQQVVSCDMTNAKDLFSHKIYQCIYYDFYHKRAHFFIENGEWYRVDDGFIKDIKRSIEDVVLKSRKYDFQYNKVAITDSAINERKNKEYIFNKELTDFINEVELAEVLDTKLINKIEVCDVIIKSNDEIILLHNKYKYGSSALSHLFSQGYVSAANLAENEFRKKANTIIKNQEMKFDVSENYSRSKYTVAYGIIGKKNKSGEITIPLFSMINLNMFRKSLKTLGYKVEVIFFEVI